MTAVFDVDVTDPSQFVLVPLAGRVLGQLGSAEQFVVWAFRQHANDGRCATRRLIDGFKLAFGEDVVATALAGFIGVERCLARGLEPRLRLCPLRCACLAADEQSLLSGLAAAQTGDRGRHREAFRQFVDTDRAAELWRHSMVFAVSLARVGLFLPDGRPPVLAAGSALH